MVQAGIRSLCLNPLLHLGAGYLLQAELCSLLLHLEAVTPVPQHVAVFGDMTFKKVSKVQ